MLWITGGGCAYVQITRWSAGVPAQWLWRGCGRTDVVARQDRIMVAEAEVRVIRREWRDGRDRGVWQRRVVDIAVGQIAVANVQLLAVVVVRTRVVHELHRWGERCEQRVIAEQSWGGRHITDGHGGSCLPHTNRLFLLPYKDIVYDGGATEQDPQANENTSYDGWCGLELGEGVQDDA